MHLRTKKNLHSHQYQSPLSQKQEVSGKFTGANPAKTVRSYIVRDTRIQDQPAASVAIRHASAAADLDGRDDRCRL